MSEEKPKKSALSACPDCGVQISIRASACPHCGAPGTASIEVRESGRTWLRRLGPIVFVVGEVVLYFDLDSAAKTGDPALLVDFLAIAAIITGVTLMVKCLKTPSSAWARFALCVLAVPAGILMLASIFGRATIGSYLAWCFAVITGIVLVQSRMASEEKS